MVLNEDLTVDTMVLYEDEIGRLIHIAESEKELFYAIDLEKGVIGFGIEASKETDDAAKKEKIQDLIAELDDPVQELYQFLP